MPRDTWKKIGITVAMPICALVLLTGACGSLGGNPTSTTNNTPRSSPVTEPTFVYPGDPQCAITYRDDGNGTMSWTANVTVAGELITHVSDNNGNIYRHDVEVSIGPNIFNAPVPLSEMGDIGGVLYVGNASYGCSIAPRR
jgi:hypothetical protein